MPAGATPGVRLGEVRCVEVHRQNHIAGVVCDYGGRVSCDVVEELVEIFHCVLRGSGLLPGKGPKGEEHSEIDDSSREVIFTA